MYPPRGSSILSDAGGSGLFCAGMRVRKTISSSKIGSASQLVLGFVLFLLLLFGVRPQKTMLGAVALMTLIVGVQHFLLSPQVADLGRKLADLPPGDALNSRFWTLHGIYSGSEILKLLIGFALAVRLATRRKQDPGHFAREYEIETARVKRT